MTQKGHSPHHIASEGGASEHVFGVMFSLFPLTSYLLHSHISFSSPIHRICLKCLWFSAVSAFLLLFDLSVIFKWNKTHITKTYTYC
jgi:hypothetical protein